MREKYFGEGLVDARTGALECSEVYVTWLNNSSLAASIRGRLVLFDAFFPDHNPGWVPTNAQEMGDARPDLLVLGHGHFDHADEAGRVLARSPRTRLVGTPEHCDQFTEALAAVGKKPNCVAAVGRGAPLGARGQLDELIPGVKISTVKIPHSAADVPDPTNANGPFLPPATVPAVRSRLYNPPAPIGPTDETQQDPVPLGNGDEGGSVLYQFRIGAFALTYHDTTGPVKVDDATWRSLRALPQTDVEYAAVVAFGTVTNGFRDTQVMTEALRSHLFLPLHHDDWNEALGTEAWSYESPVVQQLNKIPAERRPKVKWLFDPTDYIAEGVRSFDPSSRAYRVDFPEPKLSDFARRDDAAFRNRYWLAQLDLAAQSDEALFKAQLAASRDRARPS